VEARAEQDAHRLLDPRVLQRRACAALEASTWTEAELSLLLTRDEAMAGLNAQWRQDPHPTDVLSFPAFEAEALPEPGPHALGDIVINVDAVIRQASEQAPSRLTRLGLPGAESWGRLEEATFLLVHGLLHLLGHDHDEPEAEQAMVAEEARLLAPFLKPPWKRVRS
jgi:probable rRNA maturation factor